MKRLTIIISLVTLLVGSLVVGTVTAMAAPNKPAGTPVLMETHRQEAGWGTNWNEMYLRVSHVSLTLKAIKTNDPGTEVKVWVSIPRGENVTIMIVQPGETKSIEFDTDWWGINFSSDNMFASFNYCVTYPSQR